MKKIKLTQGQYALIDDIDYLLVNKYKWRAFNNLHTYYAVTSIKINGVRKQVYMHRMILDAKKGQIIDHKNGSGIDNRRKNIWICTYSDNNKNRRYGKEKIKQIGQEIANKKLLNSPFIKMNPHLLKGRYKFLLETSSPTE